MSGAFIWVGAASVWQDAEKLAVDRLSGSTVSQVAGARQSKPYSPYPGHDKPSSLDLLNTQREYLLAYCAAVKEFAQGAPALTEAGKQALIARMEQYLPAAPLTFMIGLGADAVAAELAGGHASRQE